VIAACVAVGLAVPVLAGAASAPGTASPAAAASPAGTASLAGTASAPGTARPAGAADSAPGRKLISYLGYAFKVPASWPVINDTAHPRSCVRFDIHAVYLGVPGVNQDCPSWLVGTTEAVLIQPGPAHAPRTSAENATSRQITVTAPRISLVATYDTSPAQIDRILASAALPAPVITVPDRPQLAISGQTARAREPGAGHPRRRRPLPADVTNFRGRGFDACAAPSRAYMRAWRRSSPYRAVGIYIGGADRACDQRNLTAGWVRHEARARWHFIPMHVGPQAAFRQITSPVRQAAADAVVQARRLGFGPRTPIYYDMEAFRRLTEYC
jgi:glycoside hydrolase-like protein